MSPAPLVPHIASARALMTLGMIVSAQGDDGSARQLFGEAVDTVPQARRSHGLANTYNGLGVLLINLGDLVEARAALEEARVAELAIRSSPYVPNRTWQRLHSSRATLTSRTGCSPSASTGHDAGPPIGNGVCILGLRLECDHAR